jgi:hypothetical protein
MSPENRIDHGPGRFDRVLAARTEAFRKDGTEDGSGNRLVEIGEPGSDDTAPPPDLGDIRRIEFRVAQWRDFRVVGAPVFARIGIVRRLSMSVPCGPIRSCRVSDLR